MASKFKKNYGIVEDNFKPLKERTIINEIINQSIFQRTDKPLIEQTYLALLCDCSRMTIHRILIRLKKDDWITYKMVLNSQGYTTTQFILTDKFKGLLNEIGTQKKVNKKVKERVINSEIPKIDNRPLSMDNCNF